MENRIKIRIKKGLRLTKAQVAWAENAIGKYDDDCGICLFNLCLYLGIEAPDQPKRWADMSALERIQTPCFTEDGVLIKCHCGKCPRPT